MSYFYVTLKGFPAGEGEVVTKDDKVIGTYTCDENDHCEFKPNGSDEVIISGFLIGLFCREIAEWHEKQDPN